MLNHVSIWDNIDCSFIDKYGTHVMTGLSMGGQDVVYVKQDAAASPLSPSEIRAHLDRLGDQLFTGACAVPPPHSKSKSKFKVLLHLNSQFTIIHQSILISENRI